MDKAIITKIKDSVDRSFDEQTDFLADLVGFASLRGKEAPAQEFIERAYRRSASWPLGYVDISSFRTPNRERLDVRTWGGLEQV